MHLFIDKKNFFLLKEKQQKIANYFFSISIRNEFQNNLVPPLSHSNIWLGLSQCTECGKIFG